MQWDPYDQYASGYVGMGNDPGNLVDEDGGWSSGYTGMAIGIGVGFVAPYAVQAITGKHIENKGMWGLAGAFVGAGLGYGAGAYLGGGGSIFNEMKAFYAGLFGIETPGTQIGGAKSSLKCRSVLKGGLDKAANVPDIWGGIGIGLQWVPDLKWVTVDLQNWINHELVGVKRYKDYQLMDRTTSPDGMVIQDEIITRSPYNDGQN